MVQFTAYGSVKKEITPQDLQFLRGYKPNTLLGYNDVVKKFCKYLQETGEEVFTLPILEDNIYGFCFLEGREKG